MNPKHKKCEEKKKTKTTPRHTVIKLLKPNYKNKILKVVRDKHLMDSEIMVRVTAVLLSRDNASKKTERQRKIVFKVLKVKLAN